MSSWVLGYPLASPLCLHRDTFLTNGSSPMVRRVLSSPPELVKAVLPTFLAGWPMACQNLHNCGEWEVGKMASYYWRRA